MCLTKCPVLPKGVWHRKILNIDFITWLFYALQTTMSLSEPGFILILLSWCIKGF